jgi:hypothetical protein
VSCGITSGDGKTTVSKCRLVTPKSNQSRSKVAHVPLASMLCARGSSHYLCFAGGSATRYDQRLPRRLLKLRCAPPSTASSVKRQASNAHTKASNAHAKASKLRSRLRALKDVAVAAAAATFGVDHAKASESGHLKRSFSSPPVASAYSSAAAPDTISVSSVVMRA